MVVGRSGEYYFNIEGRESRNKNEKGEAGVCPYEDYARQWALSILVKRLHFHCVQHSFLPVFESPYDHGSNIIIVTSVIKSFLCLSGGF
jgi:hypothetical protein